MCVRSGGSFEAFKVHGSRAAVLVLTSSYESSEVHGSKEAIRVMISLRSLPGLFGPGFAHAAMSMYASEIMRAFFAQQFFKGVDARKAEHAEMRRRACFSLRNAQVYSATAALSSHAKSDVFLQIVSADGFSVRCTRPGTSGSAQEEFLHLQQRIHLGPTRPRQFSLASPPVHLPKNSRASTLFSVLSNWVFWSPGVPSAIWNCWTTQNALADFDFRIRILIEDGCKTNELLERDFARSATHHLEYLRLSGLEQGPLLCEGVLFLRCLQHVLCVSRNRALLAGESTFWSSVVRFAHLVENGRFKKRLIAVMFHLALQRVKPVEVASLPQVDARHVNELAAFLRRFGEDLNLQQINLVLRFFNAGLPTHSSAFVFVLLSDTQGAGVPLREVFGRRLWRVICVLFDIPLTVPLLYRWTNSKPSLDYIARGFRFLRLLPDALELESSGKCPATLIQDGLNFDLNATAQVERDLNPNFALGHKTRLGRTVLRWSQVGAEEDIVLTSLTSRCFTPVQDVLFQRARTLTRLQVLSQEEMQSNEGAELKNDASRVFCDFVSGSAGIRLALSVVQQFEPPRGRMLSLEPLLRMTAEERLVDLFPFALVHSANIACRNWRKMSFCFKSPMFKWFDGIRDSDMDAVGTTIEGMRRRCSRCVDQLFSAGCICYSHAHGWPRLREALKFASTHSPLCTTKRRRAAAVKHA
jgi:hypothetical protein